jgi:hypothetical protein
MHGGIKLKLASNRPFVEVESEMCPFVPFEPKTPMFGSPLKLIQVKRAVLPVSLSTREYGLIAWPNELNVIGEMKVPALHQLLCNEVDGLCQFRVIRQSGRFVHHVLPLNASARVENLMLQYASVRMLGYRQLLVNGWSSFILTVAHR